MKKDKSGRLTLTGRQLLKESDAYVRVDKG